MLPKEMIVEFDVGGVLLTSDYQPFYDEAARLAGTTPKGFEEVYIPLEKRALSSNDVDYIEGVRALLRQPDMSDEQILGLAAKRFIAPVDEMVALKNELIEKGYPVQLF